MILPQPSNHKNESVRLQGSQRSRYLTIFRTHLWDKHISSVAWQLRDQAKSGDFIVAADETKAVLDVDPFPKFSHGSDFTHLGLPSNPKHKVLWWNADYPLFAIRKKFPSYDYYIMSEFDTYVGCRIDPIIDRCAEEGIDLVVHQLKEIRADNHWCYPSVSELPPPVWQALIPFVVLSSKMIDALFEERLQLASAFASGASEQWPYCEAIIPTVALHKGYKVTELSAFTDATMLRFRPFLSARDPSIRVGDRICHPVLGGRRFVAAFVANRPEDGHLLSDGYLHPALQLEDPSEVASVLGQEATKRFVSSKDGLEGLSDVALNKPATQSSVSKWSVGTTPAKDAMRANSGTAQTDFAFHTDSEIEAWWEVDLIDETEIHAVEIVNRPVVDFRFRRFRVDVSYDKLNWNTCFTKTNDRDISHCEKRPAVFRFATPVRGRFLRLVRLGDGYLHLRRVRVFGSSICPDEWPNVIMECNKGRS